MAEIHYTSTALAARVTTEFCGEGIHAREVPMSVDWNGSVQGQTTASEIGIRLFHHEGELELKFLVTLGANPAPSDKAGSASSAAVAKVRYVVLLLL